MESPTAEIQLRPVRRADLPWMYECQLDRESSAMAVVIPRESTRFFAHWEQALVDDSVCARLITVSESPAGWVSRFPCEDQATIRYWIARDFRGRGVATTALV
jgi:RimJ/RimL family protein N-acetyltransferase